MLVEFKDFCSYYRRVFGELRSELWSTWRTEAWPTVLIAAIVFALSYKQDANAKAVFAYMAESCGIYLIGWGLYHLIRAPWKLDRQLRDRLEHQATKGEILSILNEILIKINQLVNANPPTPEEYGAWRNDVNETHVWIQQALSDKVTQAEINVLLCGPNGPQLGFRGQFGMEQLGLKNHLHYLKQRLSDLIGRYC